MAAFRVAGGAAFRKPAWTLRDALADQNVRIWLAVFAFITAWNAVSPLILTTSQVMPGWPGNIGGFLAGLLGIGASGFVGTIIIAFIGACILIAILRAVSTRYPYRR